MENIGQIKKIFAPKMALENDFKKTWLSLIKLNFKVQDTAKSVNKRCGMIQRLNVQIFFYI